MPTADVTLRAALLVAGGAALGGLARWLVGAWLTRGFPWGTMAVNAAGSFLLALALFGGLARGWLSPETRLFLAVGLFGAFTTMSSFTVETLAMLEEGQRTRAAWNVLANPVLSLAAAWLGRAAAHALPGGG